MSIEGYNMDLNACILSQANILMLSFGEIAKQKKAIRTTKKCIRTPKASKSGP